MTRAGARRALAALLLVAAWAGASAAPAAAEEQPSILKAYGLDWIERVREDAWPQPKEQRPIICLLDTGVAVTPDTPEDNPLGPIVARLALDGGDGLPQGTQPEHLHGTQMASVIAAPRNGYGTVGVFPQARIVSIRVTEGNATYITPRAVSLGANNCLVWARTAGVRLAAIVMAESNYDQRPADLEIWKLAARRVNAADGVFVAAVGNSPEAELIGPMSVTDVVAVAAGGPGGALCSFSLFSGTSSPVGPGCGDDQWPAGSSAATAAVGALFAALVTRLPEMSGSSSREMLDSDAILSVGGTRRFDGTGLLGRAFAGFVASRGVDAAPIPSPSIAPSPELAEPGSNEQSKSVRLWRPQFAVAHGRGSFELRRTDRGPRGDIVVQVSAKGGPVRRSERTKLKLAKALVRSSPSLEVWIEGKSWRSLSRRVRVARR